MSLAPGQSLLHYRLLEKIGEGGMGQVFRALDTTLEREVAIKILPEAFAEDAERLARFEREAKLLASLNHPNIAVVHGLHEARGVRFLALELVRGEDLARRLSRGRLPVAEALELGRQVAEALEVAHASGVVHRDLKPANVQLTPDGKVKVLDFGLAKAMDPAPSSGEGASDLSPTVTSAGTVAGVLLGTAAYMSPEQARGLPADPRADLWAFGCLLYEMLTARRAFGGPTLSDTMAAILKEPPRWEALPAEVPAGVRRLLRRCLTKDAKQRLHSAADARIEIAEAIAAPHADDEGAGFPATPPRRAFGWPVLLGAVAATAVVASIASLLLLGTMSAPTSDRIDPQVRLRRLTFQPGLEHEPTLSPDGNYLAYATDESGNLDIVVQPLKGGTLNRITTHAADDAQPAWSPDGSRLAFVSARDRKGRLAFISGLGLLSQFVYGAGGDIFVVPAMGGPAAKLVDNGAGPDWSPAGDEIVFFAQRDGKWDIWIVSVAGGQLRRLTDDDSIEYQPAWSPDGRWIAYASGRGRDGLFVRPAAGGEAIYLTGADELVQSPAWSPDGRYLYYASDLAGASGVMNLWRLPFSSADPRPASAERVTVSEGSDIEPWLAGERRLAFSTVRFTPDIWELTVADGRLAQITSAPSSEDWPHVSRDGRLAMVSDRGDAVISLWTSNLDGSDLSRLTDATDVSSPRWSPDGRRLAYVVDRPDATVLVTREPGELSVREVERFTLPERVTAPEWSPDGKQLAYYLQKDEAADVWIRPLDGAPRRLTSQGGRNEFPTWSPDGRRIAYHHEAELPRQIWVIPADGGEAQRVTRDDAIEFSHPQWSPTDPDRILVVLDHKNLGLVSVSSGAVELLTDFDQSTILVDYPSWSADGAKAYFSLARKIGDVYLLEGY